MESAHEALFLGGFEKIIGGRLCLALLAVTEMLLMTIRFPNAGPVALCQRCAQGGDDF